MNLRSSACEGRFPSCFACAFPVAGRLHPAGIGVRNDEYAFSLLKTFLLVISLILFAGRIFSQNPLIEAETRIQAIQKNITRDRPDPENIALNDSIACMLENSLKLPGAFDYPFDSLKFLGKIVSDDKKIKILTWNLPLSDATNRYFGFIIHREDGKNHTVYKLVDNPPPVDNPELVDQWLGYLVYDIIDVKYSGETWYTLLGYDPENIFITRKLIDILWFKDNMPVFGKPVFRLKNKIQNRVIFNYSARVQMTLTWEPRLNMLVFDHLAPSSPAYQGNYQYYGPDFSYNGMRFEKGFWELIEDIDVRAR